MINPCGNDTLLITLLLVYNNVCTFDESFTHVTSINEYFKEVLVLRNKMGINRDKTEDIAIIEKILRTLTIKFGPIVVAI